jgi:hypothetical protein
MTLNEVSKDIIGMSANMASIAVRSHGYTFRITKMNDDYMCVTCDFRLDRINVEILNDKVVATHLG